MATTNYKGFILDSRNDSTYIFENGKMIASTHADYYMGRSKKDSMEKAKKFIDSGRIKEISK